MKPKRFKALTDQLWMSASILLPEQVLCKEIPPHDLDTGHNLHLPQNAVNDVKTRTFEIIKLGDRATEIDPRLKIGRQCVPIAEMMRYHSPTGILVMDAKHFAIVFDETQTRLTPLPGGTE